MVQHEEKKTNHDVSKGVNESIQVQCGRWYLKNS